MSDWTKEPFVSEPKRGETYHKARTLSAKRTLDFILQHPEGVTIKDFKKAGVPTTEIGRLQKLTLIKASQVKEPHRGTRCYYWVFRPNIQLSSGKVQNDL